MNQTALNRRLFKALSKQNFELAKKYIDKGADVNASCIFGHSIFAYACQELPINTIEFLLQNGADVNHINDAGFTPLCCAVKDHNLDKVKLLVENGADVNLACNLDVSLYGNANLTPLYFSAIKCTNTKIANYLIEQGADMNRQYGDGDTILHKIISWDTKMANLFIKNGADLNIQNRVGWTPLYYSAYHRLLDMTKLLLENGADPNINDNYGKSVLLSAVENDDEDIAKLVLKYGANPNITDKEGRTPLFPAVKFGKYSLVELLIKNGADPAIKNQYGNTALNECPSPTFFEMLKFFSQIGGSSQSNKYITKMPKKSIEVNNINKTRQARVKFSIENNDLLFFSYDNNLKKVAECISSKNFDINVQDEKGYTPLMYAIMNHNLDMVKFLVANGANINLCNKKGQSPLKIAYLYNCEDIATYLLEKGASDKIEDEKTRNEIDY